MQIIYSRALTHFSPKISLLGSTNQITQVSEKNQVVGPQPNPDKSKTSATIHDPTKGCLNY
jgi:hypothetical protein